MIQRLFERSYQVVVMDDVELLSDATRFRVAVKGTSIEGLVVIE
jgi:hypothetical protein